MAIIHAHGLFKGERLKACSDSAKLHWTYYFTASNACGRLEIDIDRIVGDAFGSFATPPTRQQVISHLKEYETAHLLFFYVSQDGSTWGQWDVRDEDLPRWRNRDAARSPAPPREAFAAWKKEYEDTKRERSHAIAREFTSIHEVPRVARESALGIGVGIGIGSSVGKGEAVVTPAPIVKVDFQLQEPPDDIGSTQLAKGLLEELEVPLTMALVDVVRLSVEAKAKTCGGLGKACSYILTQAREAKINGPPKWKFWFQDAQYDAPPERKNDHGSKRDESRRKSQESIERAFAEVDRGTD